jgi:hypothetical protein
MLPTVLVTSNGVSKELIALVIVNKLGYIVDYAQFGSVPPSSTMKDIVKRMTAAKQHSYPILLIPQCKALSRFLIRRPWQLSRNSLACEDYFAWKEETVNVLGTAGVGRLLTDAEMSTKQPEVAESVFHAQCGAVHGD